MAKAIPPHANRNLILRALCKDDLALLDPHFEPVALPLRLSVEKPLKPIEHVYFPDTGILSIVASTRKLQQGIEIGMIGREGMTGLAVVTGETQSPNETFVQVAGAGRRVPVHEMRRAMEKSPKLRATLLKYVHYSLIQIAHTAVATAKGTLSQRLARWLLMADDRMDGPSFPITHELLAGTLGVRRAGITVALGAFVKEGLIAYWRGQISLHDRAGLAKLAGGFYGTAEAEYRRVYPEQPVPVPTIRWAASVSETNI